jgi:ribose transport system substrate-binding protein
MSGGEMIRSEFVRKRSLLAAAMCVAVALALTATYFGKTAAHASVTATAASSSPFAAAVTANNDFEKRPTSIGITTPVGKKIPRGKVIDFIQCGVPACAVEDQILESGAKLLGWTVKSINAGATPQTIAAAYQQAVNNKPSAVIGSGYDRSLFNPELKELKAKHIPVLEAFVEDTAGNGITGVIAGHEQSEVQGQEVADYILAHATSKNMSIGVINPSGFGATGIEVQSLKATVSKDCKGCSVKVLQVPLTSIGSDLPTRVASFLTANPGIKWTYVGYDDMVDGLPTALQGAGIKTENLVTIDIDGSISPYLKKNQYLMSAVGVTFPEPYWRELDLLARYFAGVSYKADLNDATLPYWTVTSSNMPSNAGQVNFANVVNYVAQYKKLWGLG